MISLVRTIRTVWTTPHADKYQPPTCYHLFTCVCTACWKLAVSRAAMCDSTVLLAGEVAFQ